MPESHNKNHTLLLKANLKQLRLPMISAEFEKLSREASAAGEDYPQYLLRLTELEVAARSTNALKARIKMADFPVHKDFDTYDFSVLPSLNKQKVMELARGEWIDQHFNCCLIGNAGMGKTHLSIALGLAGRRGDAGAYDSSPPPTWSPASKKPRRSTNSTASWPSSTRWTCSSATNSAISPSAAAALNCCSRSSPTATNGPVF